LLPIARRILADEATARAEVASLVERRAGHVRLGATPSLSAELLPGILQIFRRRYDRIGVTLVEGGSRNLAESLANAELDLALMILPLHRGDTMLSATALIEEKLVLSAAANILGRPGGDISIDRLKGVPMLNYRAGYSLRETLEQACQDAGFEPNVVVDGGEMNSVVAMAEAGVGACLLPTTVARRAQLVSYNLISDRMTRTIGVAYRRGIVPSSAVRALLTVIDEQLASARFPAGIKVTGRARAQLD
ncbi:MAG: LysR family transcriptional regulator substrate-binding protein, partial [Antricoccus sp.]